MEKYLVRENLIKIIREFFYKQNFHEVIAPVLNTALPLEPNLRPFITEHKYKDIKETFYLPMSPERAIKKMLGLGLGNCFAIGHSFRNYERVGSLHLHEFLMLEWYRKNAVYTDIMDDTEQLLRTANKKMKIKIKMGEGTFPRISLNDLFEQKVGEKLDTLIADEELMRAVAKKKGCKVEKTTEWGELYDQLFVNELESTFAKEPFFLTDFPARISPLCKQKKDNPLLSERFELYINGIEIGNGNSENTDCDYVRKTFEMENRITHLPIDEEFLNSLKKMNDYGTYAGIGLGVDRLAMLFSGDDCV